MVEIARKKRAQEEMVGFALIIILVAVIFLVFLGFSLRNQEKKNVESYEVESFLQSLLQYTTKCENNVERLSIRKLISSCYAEEKCLDEKNSCDVLKSDLTGILDESWKIGEDRPVKGYELEIITDKNESILDLKKGEETRSSKGAPQDFVKSSTLITVKLRVYY